MRRFFLIAACCGVLLALRLSAIEPWADEKLPARDGLQLWYDCSRQNAGRTALQLPPLSSGNEIDYLLDASGNHRDLSQPFHDARPEFHQEFYGALLSFRKPGAALVATGLGQQFSNVTIFVVGEARANGGNFPAFFSFNQAGANDYTSGLCLDLGANASANLSFINMEGDGMNGARQMLAGPGATFGTWHVLEIECHPGKDGARLSFDGAPQSARDRDPGILRMDDFALGARHYSNGGEPPYLQGFLAGGIAEFLLYDRVLAPAEQEAVRKYLNRKYGAMMDRQPDQVAGAKPLVTVSNGPPVQMLLPGFVTRELPVNLPNINNVKYRPDGKLVALGYNGTIYLLSDPNGDGIESQVERFWTNNTLRAPIGMALTPPGYALGEGVFVASKGKLSLIVDTNNDGVADREIIVASGWQEIHHGVDALGVAIDHEGNVYFGLGTADYTNPYLVDKATGQSHYDLSSERGTILKVSPDFKQREIFCTGIRFSVALAINPAGDLFCTDQEGATWLPNGNPLDELLHIQKGRHYGFPPRHPKFLPGVIDEPSVFDYFPQHQSTCGLNFNVPVHGGPVFGPTWWANDALISGYSRGKLWRTKLIKTEPGYVAQHQLIGCLNALTVDACVSPKGDLVVATHGGEPDWGSGPDGFGKLYQIHYADTNAPQPSLIWSPSPTEIRIAFDRPLSEAALRDLRPRVDITQGRYVSAADRFEIKRPGYAAVFSQLSEPRYDVPTLGVAVTADQRTLILTTPPREGAVRYAVTLKDWNAGASTPTGAIIQSNDLDVATDLSGVEASWHGQDGSDWNGWLPHLNLEVDRSLTAESADHQTLWPKLSQPGALRLSGQLDLWQMLQPAIQPGSKLDYDRPQEEVTVVFTASTPFTATFDGREETSRSALGGGQQIVFQHRGQTAWVPFQLTLPTGAHPLQLDATWLTADDSRPRAFFLKRFLMPWAKAESEPTISTGQAAIPELAGGNWLHGRQIFFEQPVNCQRCHTVRGEGHHVGPDLSNLVERDYASVLKDIVRPSAALNPDFLAYNIELTDDDSITAVLQTETLDHITVVDGNDHITTIPKSRIKSMKPSPISFMPEGLVKDLSAQALKDLMTFLLTAPLQPAPLAAANPPPPRRRAEIEALLGTETNRPSAASSPLNIVLCAGPKDHGPGEHDYPLWQKRWSALFSLADHVTAAAAWNWPTTEQWQSANVVVFYSDNPAWDKAHAEDLDRFLARGGGVVFIHFAIDGHEDADGLAARIGLAWRGGVSKFRHGDLDLKIEPDAITAGFETLHLHDESYWNLVGNPADVHVLAANDEDGQPRPLIWTRTQGNGHVFVCIPGHFTWTFDDPAYRLLLLRGISWAAGQPLDRLNSLVLPGARIAN